MGAVGIPVFTGFTGGIAKLLGVTGGYIVGFILMGVVYRIAEKLFGKKLFPKTKDQGYGDQIGWQKHDPIFQAFICKDSF